MARLRGRPHDRLPHRPRVDHLRRCAGGAEKHYCPSRLWTLTMDFNLSEEQLMLKDGVDRFIQQEYGFETRREIAASEEGFSRARWQDYADLGWLGLMLEPFVQTALLCSAIIDRSGSDAKRQALLPAVIEGRLLLALADSEAG